MPVALWGGLGTGRGVRTAFCVQGPVGLHMSSLWYSVASVSHQLCDIREITVLFYSS